MQSNAPIAYEINGHNVRLIAHKNEPYFCAIDVCRMLGWVKYQTCMKQVDDRCNGATNITRNRENNTFIPKEGLLFIPMEDVVTLALHSNLEKSPWVEELAQDLMVSLLSGQSFNPMNADSVGPVVEELAMAYDNFKDLINSVRNVGNEPKRRRHELLRFYREHLS